MSRAAALSGRGMIVSPWCVTHSIACPSSPRGAKESSSEKKGSYSLLSFTSYRSTIGIVSASFFYFLLMRAVCVFRRDSAVESYSTQLCVMERLRHELLLLHTKVSGPRQWSEHCEHVCVCVCVCAGPVSGGGDRGALCTTEGEQSEVLISGEGVLRVQKAHSGIPSPLSMPSVCTSAAHRS